MFERLGLFNTNLFDVNARLVERESFEIFQPPVGQFPKIVLLSTAEPEHDGLSRCRATDMPSKAPNRDQLMKIHPCLLRRRIQLHHRRRAEQLDRSDLDRAAL